MSTSAELRFDALRYRRLARDILDRRAKAALEALAFEQEQAARDLDLAVDSLAEREDGRA